MKKGNFMLSNFSREKWIAGIFVLIILCVPVLTIISNLFPQSAQMEDDKGRDVLQGNGTLQDGDSEEASEDGGADDRGETERDKENNEDGKQKWFEALQGDIRDFTKNLYFKEDLISFNMNLTKTIAGNEYLESTQVLLGKENWLFYKTELDGNPLLDYKGTNHFAEEELAAMAENLVAIRDYLRDEKGIQFIIMGLPNKENMYPEYMPDTIPKLIDQSRADQVAEYLQGNTDLNYVYPKEIFLREKEEHQIYYTTDTHWNQIGAFVGLQAVFSQMYGTYSEPDSVEFNDGDHEYAGDLATIAGITDDYGIDTIYVLIKGSVSSEQYRDEVLLVVGDSFSGFLAVVAEPYYKKVYRVEPGAFRMSMLDEYQVDVVLWESVERRIEVFKNMNLLELQ